MASQMTRPLLQDLVKQAMMGTVSKVDITAEAARQLGHPVQQQTKTASVREPASQHVPTEVCEKYAAALEHLAKTAAIQLSGGTTAGVGPGEGPNAIGVMAAQSSESNIDAGQGGQAVAKDVPPKDPPLASFPDSNSPANAMATNLDMEHGEQPVDPMGNQKASNASQKQAQVNLDYLLELAGMPKVAKKGEQISEAGRAARAAGSPMGLAGYLGARVGAASSRMGREALSGKKEASLVAKNLAALGLSKQAEDAINPAQISAGAASAQGAEAPDGASAAQEGPIPPEPSDVNSQKRLIGSNQAAIDYTKRQAKADPKSDLNKLLVEPALSAAHDSTLQRVWDHTDEAGAKIAAAKLTKTAAAHAILLKLAAEQAEEKKRDKEKNSQGGGTSASLGTNVGQSNFDAKTMATQGAPTGM